MNSFYRRPAVAVANGHDCHSYSHKRNTCDGRKARESEEEA